MEPASRRTAGAARFGYTGAAMALHKLAVRALVASSVLVWAGAAQAQAPSNQDLVGTWNLTLTSPQGTHPTTVVVTEEAGQLKGALTGLPVVGATSVSTSAAGVKIAFAIDYQGQPVDIVMVGTLQDGALKGSVDYAGGAASGDFAGTKAGAAASTAGASVAGNWDISGDGGGGYSFSFTQDGTAVSGVLRTPDGAELPVKGTFTANALDLAVAADSVAGTITGTLDAGTLKGRYDIGGNAGAWSAVRKP